MFGCCLLSSASQPRVFDEVVIVAAQRQELPAGLLPVLCDGPVLFQKLRLWFWLPLQVLHAAQAT